jgi:hypothetical protein
MAKNLVLDLEHVLIRSIEVRVLHPQAEEVLEMSIIDFDHTYLWTFRSLKKGLDVLKQFSLLKYFDGIKGKEKAWYGRTYDTLLTSDGKRYHKKRYPLSRKKDLSILGNPQEFVLIEDEPSFGLPMSRVIEIEPFDGDPDHNLMWPYEQALKKFRL